MFPQHGSFVAPIRAADVRESLFIRTALETEAMRRLAAASPTRLLAPRSTTTWPLRPRRSADGRPGPLLTTSTRRCTRLMFAAVETPRALRLLDAARAPLDRVRRLALPGAGPAGGDASPSTGGWSRRCAPATPSSPPPPCGCTSAMVARTVERELDKMEEAPARRA